MTFMAYGTTITIASAGGTGTGTIDISAGKTFRVAKIGTRSTGVYKITGMKIGNVAFNSGDIHSTHLLEDNGSIFKLLDFSFIEIVGPAKLQIDITDTSSAANTINLTFFGEENNKAG